MSEKPIIFNGTMVNAILSGLKTQTRRIMKNQPVEGHVPIYISSSPRTWLAKQLADRSPYFVGDILYVRETIRPIFMTDMADGVEYRADGARRVANVENRADGCQHHRMNLAFNWNVGIEEGWDAENETNKSKWIPAIHMPKWAARLWLEVTDIQVEQLLSINERCVKAEGFSSRKRFFDTWEKLYGTESLKDNPWLWVIEFKRAEENR